MWQLSQTFAQLTAGSFSARVDVSRPQEGLFDLRPNGSLWDQARLGCVTREAKAGPPELLEAYIRGADLVATYSPDHASQVRPEIYYRALSGDENGSWRGFELILSAQTNLLGVNPALRVESHIPCGEACVLRAAGRFDAVSLTGDAASFDQEPGVFLFRLPKVDWSYVEMIFPTDFTRAELSADKSTPNLLRLTSTLFPDQLEKGVIRRARLRGLFLARSGDEAAAHAAYRQFADSPPPLTT